MTILEQYYRDNYSRLCKIAYSQLDQNWAWAEEVVQESFARALTFMDSYDNQSEFGAWFWVLLTNRIKDARREERNRGMAYELNEDITPFNQKDDILSITKGEISSSISALKDGTAKNVLDLYFNKGMLPTGICDVLRLESNGYVRFIISDWRRRMIRKYDDDK